MRCAECGATNPDGADWCSQCLSRFAPAPPADTSCETPASSETAPPAVERDGDSTAFFHTISTTLTRLVEGGPLFYVEPGGDPQAVVAEHHLVMSVSDRADALMAGESPRHLADRFDCLDLDDAELFHVERYRATNEPAFTVYAPDDLPLATYICHNGLVHDDVEMRDGTGAPVACMRRQRHRWELIETGGREIGFCWSQPMAFGESVDNQWGLTLFERPDVFDRRGLLAAPLICRLFWDNGPRRRARGEDVDLGGLALFLTKGV